MTTAIASLRPLSEATGLAPSACDRLLRNLRSNGFLEAGSRGGGKRAAHFDVPAFARIVLGFGGERPSDGAAAVRSLSALVASQRSVRQDLPAAFGTLRAHDGEWLIDYIERQITQVGDPVRAEELDQLFGGRVEYVLCPGVERPPERAVSASAVVVWREKDGLANIAAFEPAQASLPHTEDESIPSRARKQAVLPFRLIIVTGRLAADTAQRRGRTAGQLRKPFKGRLLGLIGAVIAARCAWDYPATGPPYNGLSFLGVFDFP